MPKKKLKRDRFSRRDFLKVGGGATVLGATGMALPGPQNPTQRADALVVSAGLIGVSIATAYVVDRVADSYTGNDFDEAAYDSASDQEAWAGTYQKATEMQYYDDQVFTQINNLLVNSKQIAYGDARYAAIEAMNAGKTESEVLDAARAKVDSYFATQQLNLLDHWEVQAGKTLRMASVCQPIGTLDMNSVGAPEWYVVDDSGSINPDGSDLHPDGAQTHTKTLVDGSTYDATALATWYDGSPSIEASPGSMDDMNTWVMTTYDGSGEPQEILDIGAYHDIYTEIQTLHSETKTEIENWVSAVYSNYTAGDIDLSDVLYPSDLAKEAHTDSETPLSGADLALMGLKTDTDARMAISADEDRVVFDGSLYVQNDTSTDLEVGRQYSPGDFTGSVYLTYQDYTLMEGSSFDDSNLEVPGVIHLQQPFTILSAKGADGTEKENVTFEEEDGQETTTTDIQALKEELARLQDLQAELQEQQKDIAEGDTTDAPDGGGMFDFSAFGIKGEYIALGAAGVVALLGLSNN